MIIAPAKKTTNIDIFFFEKENSYTIKIVTPLGEFNKTNNKRYLFTNDLQITKSFRTLGFEESRQIYNDKQIGALLFEDLFDANSLSILRRYQDSSLKIRLRLRFIDAPSLSALPWEILFDKYNEKFFVLYKNTTLFRYIELARPADKIITIGNKLNILIIISSAKDLNTEKEWKTINDSFSELIRTNKISLEKLISADLDSLQRQIRIKDYHIIHFIGHGIFDKKNKTGKLLFSNPKNKSQLVDAEQLGRLLCDSPSIGLVFLNACDSAKSTEDIIFNGFAQKLVQVGIPASLAMQDKITDSSAIRFSKEFYTALADGLVIDEAVTEGRKAISNQLKNNLEWYIPVLYTHSPDGIIFNFRKMRIKYRFSTLNIVVAIVTLILALATYLLVITAPQTIEGIIVDSNGKPLKNAHIYLPLFGKDDYTNEYGYYKIHIYTKNDKAIEAIIEKDKKIGHILVYPNQQGSSYALPD